MKSGRRSKRSSFRPSLGKMLRRVSDWAGRSASPAEGAKAPVKPRRQGFVLETIEPRVLMSADINTFLTGVTDFTVKAEQASGKFFVNVYDTASPGTKIDGVELNDAGDVSVNIARPGGDVGGGLFADTWRLDLDTLSSIKSFVSGNGGLLSIDFKGGSELVKDDHLIVKGTGLTTDYSLKVTADTDITLGGAGAFNGDLTIQSDDTITGNATTKLSATNLTLKAEALKDGGILGTGFLADAKTSITLTDSSLTAANKLDITAHGNSKANDDGTKLSLVTGAVLTSNSAATINIGGAAQLSGVDVTLTSLVDGNLVAKADKNTIKLVVVQGSADPQVNIGGSASVVATGKLTASATSDIKITTSASPDVTAKSAKADAAILSTTFKSGATLAVNGAASLTATNAVSLTASSKINTSSMADANVVGTAGAAVAVTVVFGDTTASIDGTGGAKVSGSAVTLAASTDRTLSTTAKSSPGGSDSNSGSNKSEQTLASNKAATSQGSVTIAGAVAVSTDTGSTKAFLNNATIDAKSGAAKVNASTVDVVSVTADGQATKSNTTGVGVGVAIGVANRSAQAYLTGANTITGSSLDVAVLAPSGSSFSADATSGVGASSKVGVAGSLAINVTVFEHKAYLDDGATLTLNGSPNVTFTASAIMTHATHALPSAAGNSDPSKVGVGASVAVTYEEDTTTAYIGNAATLTGANNLSLTADARLETDTEAKAGSKGGTAITPVVAITIVANDTSATLGSGGLLTIGGAFSASASLANNVATTAEGDTLSGSTGVGISIAVSVINDTALATTGRDLTTVAGAAAFLSRVVSGSQSTARASVAGGEEDDGSGTQAVDNKTGGEQNFGSKTASDQTTKANPSGTTKGTKGAAAPSAGTSSGKISVAGAVAVNIEQASSKAFIGTGRVINAAGVLTVQSSANVDGTAVADGSAVIGS